MSTRSTHLIVLAVLAASLIVGALAYPRLPAEVVTHWNAAGQPDNFGSPLFAVLVMPAATLLMYGIFLLIPRIDPLKDNVAAFRGYFNAFVVSVVIFLGYIGTLTLAWNLGVQFDLGRAMAPAMGALFFVAGVLLEHARPNWFIGIRTPWTLSSEAVWYRTHRLGARLFKGLGVLAVMALLVPGQYALWLVVVPVLLVAAWSFVYSYWAYTQERARE